MLFVLFCFFYILPRKKNKNVTFFFHIYFLFQTCASFMGAKITTTLSHRVLSLTRLKILCKLFCCCLFSGIYRIWALIPVIGFAKIPV